MIITPEIEAILLIVSTPAELIDVNASVAYQHPRNEHIQFYYYPYGHRRDGSAEYVSAWNHDCNMDIYNSEDMMEFIVTHFIN